MKSPSPTSSPPPPPSSPAAACIYINKISRIHENTSFNDNKMPFIMELAHSVDIDNPNDLELAKYYINMQN